MTPRHALATLLLVAAGHASAADTPKAGAVVCPAPCVDDARSRPKANVEDPRVMKRAHPAITRAEPAPAPAAGSEPAQAPDPKATSR